MIDDAGGNNPRACPRRCCNGSFSAAEIAFAPGGLPSSRAVYRSISVIQLACWISLSSRPLLGAERVHLLLQRAHVHRPHNAYLRAPHALHASDWRRQ